MKLRGGVTLLAGSLCLLALKVPPAVAAGQHSPRIVGDKTSTSDLMTFLGIHSWKVRVVGPLHSVSVMVIQYTRAANGQFVQGAVLGSQAIGYQAGTKAVSVVVLLQDAGKTVRLGLVVQGGGSPPIDFPASTLAGYTRWGDGAGGEGLKVGGEDILMAKYANPRVVTPLKKDMLAYVVLQVVVRK